MGVKGEKGEQSDETKENVRDWSSLTETLLFQVVKLLDTLQDAYAFRSVCRNWRSVARSWMPFSMSSQSPLIILERSKGGVSHGYYKVFYDISKKHVYKTLLPLDVCDKRIVGYSHGHIFASTCTGTEVKYVVCNLFTGATISLPCIDSAYNHCSKKFILSSSPLSPGCMAVLFMVSFRDCPSGCIYYIQLGHDDQHWRNHTFELPGIIDMIFLRGKFYALSRTGKLGIVSFDPDQDPELTLLDNARETDHGILDLTNHRLAELRGDLLVVSTSHWRQWKYDIWRWDFERGCGFVKVSSLQGGALFILASSYFAGSVAAASAMGAGVRENCIYHIDCFSNNWSEYMIDNGSFSVVTPIVHDLIYRLFEHAVWIFPSNC